MVDEYYQRYPEKIICVAIFCSFFSPSAGDVEVHISRHAGRSIVECF